MSSWRLPCSCFSQDWFNENVAPLLIQEQVKATNHFGMTYIRNLRLGIQWSEVSNERKGPWLFGVFFGDETLPSYVVIISLTMN